MTLQKGQLQQLLCPLEPSRIQHVQGQAHLAAWDVQRWLIRIFGFTGWRFEIVHCDMVSERSEEKPSKRTGQQYTAHTVVYRVLGRLSIYGDDGEMITFFEDGATGDSVNQPSLGDAHDMALKTAISQALKRCAVNLGDQFGLSLYNNGKPDGVVSRTLVHSSSTPVEELESSVEGDTEGSIPQTSTLVKDAEPAAKAESGPSGDPRRMQAVKTALGKVVTRENLQEQIDLIDEHKHLFTAVERDQVVRWVASAQAKVDSLSQHATV